MLNHLFYFSFYYYPVDCGGGGAGEPESSYDGCSHFAIAVVQVRSGQISREKRNQTLNVFSVYTSYTYSCCQSILYQPTNMKMVLNTFHAS